MFISKSWALIIYSFILHCGWISTSEFLCYLQLFWVVFAARLWVSFNCEFALSFLVFWGVFDMWIPHVLVYCSPAIIVKDGYYFGELEHYDNTAEIVSEPCVFSYFGLLFVAVCIHMIDVNIIFTCKYHNHINQPLLYFYLCSSNIFPCIYSYLIL